MIRSFAPAGVLFLLSIAVLAACDNGNDIAGVEPSPLDNMTLQADRFEFTAIDDTTSIELIDAGVAIQLETGEGTFKSTYTMIDGTDFDIAGDFEVSGDQVVFSDNPLSPDRFERAITFTFELTDHTLLLVDDNALVDLNGDGTPEETRVEAEFAAM